MDLGPCAICLCVQDIDASREFYSKLGFDVVEEVEGGRKVLRQGETVVGLFRSENNPGMPAFSLSFNPTNVRAIHRELGNNDIDVSLLGPNADAETGHAWFTLTDPDGNAILVEQFD